VQIYNEDLDRFVHTELEIKGQRVGIQEANNQKWEAESSQELKKIYVCHSLLEPIDATELENTLEILTRERPVKVKVKTNKVGKGDKCSVDFAIAFFCRYSSINILPKAKDNLVQRLEECRYCFFSKKMELYVYQKTLVERKKTSIRNQAPNYFESIEQDLINTLSNNIPSVGMQQPQRNLIERLIDYNRFALSFQINEQDRHFSQPNIIEQQLICNIEDIHDERLSTLGNIKFFSRRHRNINHNKKNLYYKQCRRYSKDEEDLLEQIIET